MTFPSHIPGDAPCVLADGVPFVPGMLVWDRSPLGEPEAIQTDHWEACRVVRWGKGDGLVPYTLADMEWAFFLPSGGMVGVAALFVSRPVGRIPQCL